MRSRGHVISARGLGDSDHLSWVYDDATDCHSQAVTFLDEGRARGLRLAYTGAGDLRQLRAQLKDLPGRDEMLASGALEILALESVYGAGPVHGPTVVGRYAGSTAQALADGYRGYRVAADVTSLVGSAAGLDAFARYEIDLDTYMAAHPFSAMCAYAGSVGADQLAELACVHPLGMSAHAPFQITIDAGGVVQLDGEVDLWSRRAFAETVTRIDDALQARPRVVDLSGVVHIDHRGLLALEHSAARRQMHLLLRAAPPIVRRLLTLLDAPHLEVEAAR